MATKLFVGKLSFDTTNASLLELFKQYGEVTEATIIYDKVTRTSRGFGFVEMNSTADAQNAIKELDGKEFEGRTIVVNVATPPTQSSDNRNNQGAGHRRSW